MSLRPKEGGGKLPLLKTWVIFLLPKKRTCFIYFHIFLGISADLIGRKKSMLTVAVLVLASWTILAVANSVVYLYIGRLLAGFALGWGMTVQPLYLGEIATVIF